MWFSNAVKPEYHCSCIKHSEFEKYLPISEQALECYWALAELQSLCVTLTLFFQSWFQHTFDSDPIDCRRKPLVCNDKPAFLYSTFQMLRAPLWQVAAVDGSFWKSGQNQRLSVRVRNLWWSFWLRHDESSWNQRVTENPSDAVHPCPRAKTQDI